MDQFDGKSDDLVYWRMQLSTYISNEDLAYEKMIDWAREQTSVISEQVEDDKAREIFGKLGLDIKEFSKKLYSFLVPGSGKQWCPGWTGRRAVGWSFGGHSTMSTTGKPARC